MKKRPLLFVAMMLFANVAFTQNFSHTIYGNSLNIDQPGETGSGGTTYPDLGNEVGTLVRPTSDGGAVIVGYRSKVDGSGDIYESHLTMFKIRKNNTSTPTVVWENNEILAGLLQDDMPTDMIISTDPGTGDEYVIIVGTGDRTSPESDNKPFIYKVDASNGLIVGLHIWEDPNLTGGIVYKGVCELDNGDFVAVGSYDLIPSSIDPASFISVYDNNLNLRYHHKVDYNQGGSNMSDSYYDVVANGNSVFVVGAMSLTGSNKRLIMTLSSITPNTSSGTFTLNWFRAYSPVYTHNGDDYKYVFPQDLYIVDNQSTPGEKVLIISSEMSPQAGNHTEHQHVITRVDNIRTANTPVLSDFFSRYVDNKKSSGGGLSYSAANTSALYPMSENHFFIAQSPSDIYYSPNFNGFGLDNVSDGWVSEVSDFTNGTVSNSFSIGMDEEQAILDMTYDGVWDKMIIVGYQETPEKEAPGGFLNFGTDIYYGEFKTTLPLDYVTSCPHPDQTVELHDASNEEYALGLNRHENVIDGSYLGPMALYIELQHVAYCGNIYLKPGPTSVSNALNSRGEITVHPNPANSYVTLDMFSAVANDIRIDVVDVSGKVLISNSYSTNKGENSFTFDVRSLPGGVYVLKVYDGGTVAVEKLIKQ